MDVHICVYVFVFMYNFSLCLDFLSSVWRVVTFAGDLKLGETV